MNYKELRNTGILNGETVLLLPQNNKNWEFGRGLWDWNIDAKEMKENDKDFDFLSSLEIKHIETGANKSTSMDENENDNDYYDKSHNEGHQFYDLSAYDLVIIVELEPNKFKDFILDKIDNEEE